VGGWVRDALLGVLRWGERGVTLGNNEFMGIGGDRKERERERERERDRDEKKLDEVIIRLESDASYTICELEIRLTTH